nr:MAG TPA: hypothetical protein [Caudoviricetes sp.]
MRKSQRFKENGKANYFILKFYTDGKRQKTFG